MPKYIQGDGHWQPPVIVRGQTIRDMSTESLVLLRQQIDSELPTLLDHFSGQDLLRLLELEEIADELDIRI
jgi:hypothetical protein